MPKLSETFLAGLVSPAILKAIEQDSLSPVFLDLQACNALEIRYDFFEQAEWESLSARVRRVAPQAMQIGTIRLKRDGGKFPDAKAVARPELWEKILEADEAPEWLDLERDCLAQFADLKAMAKPRGTKILVSEHNFIRIPNDMVLKTLVDDLRRVKADGLKIAAMSNSEDDCDRLYKFTKKNNKYFDLFAAFAMGDTGRTSRLWSLKEGANLTYGAIEAAEAPGQIDVMTMKKALDNFENLFSKSDTLAFLDKFRQF
ncbi:type I 3-dehydroquinate dehydratase [Fibrobacter sp. UWP2]|uniref:type I 3-dehydroquinate dehydratase n=1 Tax=Fibrobacter sp. UWP2 TaxID=1896216 RepID=UPI0009106478|nr:type I 3-dehydroquinate dehydratase [Fibrobacter sp. UWP2]SHI54150.1 3-dehydroquinate dehydratase [Fibrobacter sp. UWP2]